MAALAWTPKDRDLKKNPGRFEDCKEKPLLKKTDLEAPSDDLIDVVKQAMEGHKGVQLELALACKDPYKGAERAAEKGKEDIV